MIFNFQQLIFLILVLIACHWFGTPKAKQCMAVWKITYPSLNNNYYCTAHSRLDLLPVHLFKETDMETKVIEVVALSPPCIFKDSFFLPKLSNKGWKDCCKNQIAALSPPSPQKSGNAHMIFLIFIHNIFSNNVDTLLQFLWVQSLKNLD